MKDLDLWLEAIEQELDTVRVNGRKDISTMNKVFNTLNKLKEEAKIEGQDQQGT